MCFKIIAFLFKIQKLRSLLAEVSHNEPNERRGERPLPASEELFDEAADQISDRNLLVFKTGFVYVYCVLTVCALLDCTLTIIEPTVVYGLQEIHEFRKFLTLIEP